MERRDRSLKALYQLIYLDTQDDEVRAKLLVKWSKDYISDDFLDNLDLDTNNLKKLSELFYKNINFLKTYKDALKIDLKNHDKMKKFFQ